jgi:hypothetical protein
MFLPLTYIIDDFRYTYNLLEPHYICTKDHLRLWLQPWLNTLEKFKEKNVRKITLAAPL